MWKDQLGCPRCHQREQWRVPPQGAYEVVRFGVSSEGRGLVGGVRERGGKDDIMIFALRQRKPGVIIYWDGVGRLQVCRGRLLLNYGTWVSLYTRYPSRDTEREVCWVEVHNSYLETMCTLWNSWKQIRDSHGLQKCLSNLIRRIAGFRISAIVPQFYSLAVH